MNNDTKPITITGQAPGDERIKNMKTTMLPLTAPEKATVGPHSDKPVAPAGAVKDPLGSEKFRRVAHLFTMTLAAGAACLLFTGCATTQLVLEHKNLKVQTRMSHTIFLDVEKAAQRTVLLDVKNTSDKNVEVAGLIQQRLEGRGYRIVNSPDEAFYIVQANILRVGLHDPSALRESSFDPLDTAGVGVAAGATISALSDNLDGLEYGAAIGLAAGAADFIAGALIKNVTYSMITDLQILEKTDEKVSQTVQSNLGQGSGTRVLQTSESVRERRKFQTQILSTANRVNLKFDTALPALEEQLAKSIAGIL